MDAIVVGAMVLMVIVLSFTVIPKIARARRLKLALTSDVVNYAAQFWTEHVTKELPRYSGRADNKEAISEFRENIRQRLASAYAEMGSFPDLGVFFFAPHQYGVCPLLAEAGRHFSPNGEILQGMLPSFQMRIRLDCIEVERLNEIRFRQVWRSGQTYRDLRNSV